MEYFNYYVPNEHVSFAYLYVWFKDKYLSQCTSMHMWICAMYICVCENALVHKENIKIFLTFVGSPSYLLVKMFYQKW